MKGYTIYATAVIYKWAEELLLSPFIDINSEKSYITNAGIMSIYARPVLLG